MQLAQNFTLAEFLKSSTANKLGIKNEPNAQELENLKALAAALQRLRGILGAPIVVNSAFRSEALNKAVGGVENSDHRQGFAADIRAPAFGSVIELGKAIARCDLKFDQLIYEQDGGAEWIHMSVHPRMRQQVISWKRGKGYANGIVKM